MHACGLVQYTDLQEQSDKSAVSERRLRQGREAEDLDQVHTGLFVGALDAAEQLDVLQKHNITHVISILSNRGSAPSTFAGIHYLRFRLEDDVFADIAPFFARTYRFIQRAHSGSVLIHCFMGISRSVTLACSYLMRKQNWTVDRALEHIRESRQEACPNAGFMQELYRFE